MTNGKQIIHKLINEINAYLRLSCVLGLQMINLKNPQNIAEFFLQSFRNFNVCLILNVVMNQVHHLSVEIDEVKLVRELEDSSEEGRDFRQITFVCFQHFRSVIQIEEDVIGVRE
jgi:hypothetical protein